MRKLSIILFIVAIPFLAVLTGCGTEGIYPEHAEGDILWQRTVGENIETTTTVDEKGNIYTTGGGYIWSFTSGGKLRWKTCPLDEGCKGLEQEYPYALGVASSPAVSPDGKKVYITGYAGVFAFRTRDGKLLWKKTVFDNYYEFAEKEFEEQQKIWEESASKEYPKIFATTPAISADGSRLYAGCGENDFSCDSFYCINAKNGSVIWEYVMEHPPQQIEEGKYTRGYLGGACLGADGTVYVASMHGWLVSLTDNGDSYTENWAYNVGAEMRMPPSMDAEGFLYVGSSSAGGYIHKVDSRTGEKAAGKWPVKTFASEVFANIAIASDGTIYANSEDYRLWAFNPDGTVKWNNLKFEHWGGDPLIRADDKIIVTSQLKGAARVVCIRDDGDEGVIEWFSEPITTELAYNETNVNISPNGDIYVASGVMDPHALFAIKGNGLGLSKASAWPKYMGNIQNNGQGPQSKQTRSHLLKGDILLHDPSGIVQDDGYLMTYATGRAIKFRYKKIGTEEWIKGEPIFARDKKPAWMEQIIPGNKGFWAPHAPSARILYYSTANDAWGKDVACIGRAVAAGDFPSVTWIDDGEPVLVCDRDDIDEPFAIDPAVFEGENNSLWLVYGSHWSGIWVVQLDPETGHIKDERARKQGWKKDNPAFSYVASELGRFHEIPQGQEREENFISGNIEAPYIFWNKENHYYYLFVNWGICCSGADSTYEIRIGRSRKPNGPYLDKDGHDMAQGGGTLFLERDGRFIGPGHANIYQYKNSKGKQRFILTHHFYDGMDDGRAKMHAREILWASNDWPVLTDNTFIKKE